MPIFIALNQDNIKKYFSNIAFLFMRNRIFLLDDYSNPSDFGEFLYRFISERTPFFWVIFKDKTFAGFVFLDNLTGNQKNIYSAELTTCFDKKFWGDFTRASAFLFLNLCFETLNLYKIKAKIYPENNRVRSILRWCNFKKEGLFTAETVHNGKFQNIEVYGLINPKIRKEIL